MNSWTIGRRTHKAKLDINNRRIAPKNQESEACIDVEVKCRGVECNKELLSRGSPSRAAIFAKPFLFLRLELGLENGRKLELRKWNKAKKKMDMGAFRIILNNLYCSNLEISDPPSHISEA